jgi:hypothetical protein
LESFDDNVSNVTEHELVRKKCLVKPGGQQAPKHIKRPTRNLQLQFSPKSYSRQLENVERSKQNKLSKHEGEMQS